MKVFSGIKEVNHDICDSVVCLYPKDDEREVYTFIEFEPDSKRVYLFSKTNFSPAKYFTEWANSDDFKNSDNFKKIFNPKWKEWLKEQSEYFRELYEVQDADEA